LYVGRGVVGRLVGALGLIFSGSPLNAGETNDAVSIMQQAQALAAYYPAPPTWVRSADMTRGSITLTLGPGRSPVRPIVLPAVSDPELQPIGDPALSPVGDPYRNPAYYPTPQPVGDPLVRSLPETAPSRAVARELRVGVVLSERGEPQVRIRAANRPAPVLSYPRYRDTKAGKQLMGYVNLVVNATWGTVDEAAQLVEAMAWNMYVQTPSGVLPAMTYYRGSVVSVFNAYLSGNARLDSIGFVQDYALSQAGDLFVATVLRNVDRAAYALGWNKPVGITSETLASFVGGKLENSNVSLQSPGDALSSLWGSFSEWAASFDVRRQSRASSLWS
jgi:hypothetical protein